MARAFITGCSRGIGAALAKQLARDGWDVLASCRTPDAAKDQFQGFSHIQLLKLDVTSIEDLTAVVAELKDVAIDLLINNAAIFGQRTGSFLALDYEAWLRTLNVNCVSQIRVCAALLPNLRLGERKLAIFVGSKAGLPRLIGKRGVVVYPSTKSALASSVRSVAMELREEGICCVLLNPGLVRSGLGGPQAPMSPEDSASRLVRVIGDLSMSDAGKFIHFDGTTIPL